MSELSSYYDPSVIENMTNELLKHLKIIDGLISGKSYREIGKEFDVGPSTIGYFKQLHFPDAPIRKCSTRLESKINRENKLKQNLQLEKDRDKLHNSIRELIGIKSYRQISDDIGCSIGLISKIANEQ